MPVRRTQCAFCGRVTTTREHHVVPRSKGGKVILPTCESCENFIHNTWSHTELHDRYDTVEKVQADERFQRFLSWLLKQPVDAVYRTRRTRD